MVNGPLRGGEDINSWPLVLQVYDEVTLGGKSSENSSLDISDQHLMSLANGRFGVVVPIRIEDPIATIRTLLYRMIGAGVKITGVRFGNEKGNNADLSNVSLSMVENKAREDVDAYLYECAPFVALVNSMITCQHIYCGVYPHQTLGGNRRFPLYKEEWTTYLDTKLNKGDGIDIHIYDQGLPEIMSEELLLEFFSLFTRPIYVIEAGCKPITDRVLYKERTFAVWEMLQRVVEPKDVRGAQLMEHTKHTYGLIHKGKLTEYGLKYLSIPRTSRPRVVGTPRLSFGFLGMKWWIAKLSNGEEKKIKSLTRPEAGSFA
jgi:hypothetical protein